MVFFTKFVKDVYTRVRCAWCSCALQNDRFENSVTVTISALVQMGFTTHKQVSSKKETRPSDMFVCRLNYKSYAPERSKFGPCRISPFYIQ